MFEYYLLWGIKYRYYQEFSESSLRHKIPWKKYNQSLEGIKQKKNVSGGYLATKQECNDFKEKK